MRRVKNGVADWLDADRLAGTFASGDTTIDWVRTVPYLGVHLACLGVIWVGWSWTAVAVAVALYVARMFAITGFYHRYFSHKSFKTSRAFQFVMAVWGASSVQRGPLWWAAHHRHHHQHSDDEADWHSPTQRGFWFAHMGWFLTKGAFATQTKYIRDLLRFPELRLIDRFDWIVPVMLAAGTYGLGALLEREAPGLGTSGPQMLVWGFFISTVVNYHATYTINSLSHVFGRRRFATRDTSRNNWLLALITLGEGWHNNHHHFSASARQGFYWWEIDVTYYVLKVMSWMRLVWDLKPVPPQALERGRIDGAEASA
jgi:stearoyl-CoA desaturase (delta-9 desaturase)